MPFRPGLIAVVLSAALVSCDSIQGTEARIAFLQTRLDGDVALGPSSGTIDPANPTNDIHDDLGLGGANDSLMLAVVVPTDIGRFGASGFWFSDSGQGTLGADFGDIPTGANVLAKSDFVNVKAYWVYDVLKNEHFRLAPGVAVNFIDYSLQTRSTTAAGTFEEVDVFAPVPLVYLDGDARFGQFVVAAQGGGMSIHLNDGDGIYWDFEGRVGFLPTEDVEVFAGYRLLTMDSNGVANTRDADVDLMVHGWFLGGSYRF